MKTNIVSRKILNPLVGMWPRDLNLNLGSRAGVALLLISSIAFSIMTVQPTASQYVTTTVTNQVYNQPFYLQHIYESDNVQHCSIEYLPDAPMNLSPGDTISGSLSAGGNVILAIVTGGLTSVNAVSCSALLYNVLYYRAGESYQYQWSVPANAGNHGYYVAIDNPSKTSDVSGVLVINTITSLVTEQQQYTPTVYTTPTQTPNSPTYSTITQPAVQSQSIGLPTFSNLPLVPTIWGIAIAVAIVIILFAMFHSRRHKSVQTKLDAVLIPPSTAISQPTTVTQAFMFCSQCGAQIPGNSKFCRKCGSKQI